MAHRSFSSIIAAPTEKEKPFLSQALRPLPLAGGQGRIGRLKFIQNCQGTAGRTTRNFSYKFLCEKTDDFLLGMEKMMIILITGASHTGKTVLAQKLLEKYKYPYFSIDHLKMGLIRSGYTKLTPEEDAELEAYMWPIIREMIKTAIENKQNLVIEGGYIPFDWKKDFTEEYLDNIKFYCLVMSENYIKNHFDDIKKYASDVENRIDDDWCTMESVLEDNVQFSELAKKHNANIVLVDDKYEINIDL